MSAFRAEKLEGAIREMAAMHIEREAGRTAMITVTRVVLSPDSKRATIMISVLPREKENAAFGFVKRNLGDLRTSIAKGLKINPVPFLDVVIDEGEKNRQKIDELLRNG